MGLRGHKLKGNKNAVKEVTASAVINFRLTEQQKSLLSKIAAKQNKSLTKWLIDLAKKEIKDIYMKNIELLDIEWTDNYLVSGNLASFLLYYDINEVEYSYQYEQHPEKRKYALRCSKKLYDAYYKYESNLNNMDVIDEEPSYRHFVTKNAAGKWEWRAVTAEEAEEHNIEEDTMYYARYGEEHLETYNQGRDYGSYGEYDFSYLDS